MRISLCHVANSEPELDDTKYKINKILSPNIYIGNSSEIYKVIDAILILKLEDLACMQFDILGLVLDGLRIDTNDRISSKLIAIALRIKLFIDIFLKAADPLGQAAPAPFVPFFTDRYCGIRNLVIGSQFSDILVVNRFLCLGINEDTKFLRHAGT